MNRPTPAWLSGILHSECSLESTDTTIRRVSIDSRAIQENDVFWAIQGTRDGHGFVEDALSRGAMLAVVETAFLQQASTSLCKKLLPVTSTRDALRVAAIEWRKQFRGKVIGVTGSNGKTTTKDILLHFLKSEYSAAGTAGNFNNELGVPLTLLGMEASNDFQVVEMGAAKRGDITYLCDIARPTHGLVTSISAAHLEGFGTVEEVARTKGELYAALASDGIAFVPTDDERCVVESGRAATRTGYSFAARPPDWQDTFVAGTNLKFNESAHPSFQVHEVQFCLPFPGKPIAQAGLAAAAVAVKLGVDLSKCAASISTLKLTSGRMSVIHSGALTILDDSYNANPQSMAAALETLSLLPGGQKSVILGDMKELGDFSESEHHTLAKKLIPLKLYRIVLVGEQMRSAAELLEDHDVKIAHFDTVESLLPNLRDTLAGTATVLVKASRSLGLDLVVQQLRS